MQSEICHTIENTFKHNGWANSLSLPDSLVDSVQMIPFFVFWFFKLYIRFGSFLFIAYYSYLQFFGKADFSLFSYHALAIRPLGEGDKFHLHHTKGNRATLTHTSIVMREKRLVVNILLLQWALSQQLETFSKWQRTLNLIKLWNDVTKITKHEKSKMTPKRTKHASKLQRFTPFTLHY